MAFTLSPEAAASGARVLSYETIGSTSTEAMARLRDGEGGPLWVAASRQTAGRGRRGSVWQDDGGNLAASLGLRLDLDPAALATLGFVAGVATVRALERCRASSALSPAGGGSTAKPAGWRGEAAYTRDGALSGEVGHPTPDLRSDSPPPKVGEAVRFNLKWPNDVLADGAKLVGILLETELSAAGRLVVVGIGVNVARAPEGLAYPAASLQGLGLHVSAAEVFSALTAEWKRAFAIWDMGRGFSAIRQAWLDHAGGLGGPVTIRSGAAKHITGTFDTIDTAGQLVLTDAHGARHTVSAGEVHFGEAATLRPEIAA